MKAGMVIGAVNETLYEEFLIEASGAIASASVSEVGFELFVYALMALFAFQIYREVSKLYSIIEYEGLSYFKKTFFFYSLANFLLVVINLSFLLLKLTAMKGLELFLLSLVFFTFLIGISSWAAKANLLASITWKLVEEYVRKKRARRFLFFSSLMLFVMVDLLVEFIISTLGGTYAAFGYRGLIFVLILLLIRSNMRTGDEKKPISHPYYLALILLFTVNFLSNSLNLIEERYDLLYTALDILTVLAYAIILKGIKKWSRILVE